VIVDRKQRYLAARADNGDVVRFDRRWRRTERFTIDAPGDVRIVEGNGALAVVTVTADGSIVDATVRSAHDPAAVIAVGRYDDGWVFDGDKQAWTSVPEYLLLHPGDGQLLVRIADDAEADPLEDQPLFGSVTSFPDARLLALTTHGKVVVYDPVTRKDLATFRLSVDVLPPQLQFREGGKEMWLDDTRTIMKLDTRAWNVLDAAGPDHAEAESDDDEEEGDADAHGRDETSVPGIGAWALSSDERHCAVAVPGNREVLVLDAGTMLPVAQLAFDASPDDVALLDGGSVVIFDRQAGRFFQRSY
jgi:hypothetical protein